MAGDSVAASRVVPTEASEVERSQMAWHAISKLRIEMEPGGGVTKVGRCCYTGWWVMCVVRLRGE